jgi:nicotinamidase/pyrazinamidase
MQALVLVDIQKDFLPGGALAVPLGDQIVPVVNRWMDRFAMVVATRDWHPADHVSFASQHPGRKVGEVVIVEGEKQILWPDHCVQETPGAEFADGLLRERIERVFSKGADRRVDSYSGFFDRGRRHATGLDAYLRERGATAVFLMGLATDYCVRYTALDARQLGWDTTVVLEGCRGINLSPGDVERAVAELVGAGVVIS